MKGDMNMPAYTHVIASSVTSSTTAGDPYMPWYGYPFMDGTSSGTTWYDPYIGYQYASYQQVGYQAPYIQPKPDRCEYCGSRCEDKHGNCGACGAPLP